MKTKFNGSNNSGNLVLMAVGLMALGGVVVVTGVNVTKSIIKDRVYQKDKNNIERASSRAVSLLQDQYFCAAFFKNGYAGTNVGTYNFLPATTGAGSAGTVIENLEKDIVKKTQLHVTSFQLSNQRIVDPGSIEKIKIFDLTVNLKQKTSDSKDTIFQVTAIGVNPNNPSLTDESKKLHLVLGEKTGRCSIAKGLYSANSMNANRIVCETLGETFDASTGSCKLKQVTVTQKQSGPYKVSVLGSTIQPGESNFANAFCTMELNLLRKGPASGYNSAHLWTQLCLKPQWAGCYVQGNNVKLNYQPGSKVEKEGRAKRAGDWLNPVLEADSEIKVSRNFGPLDTSGINKSFGNTSVSGGISNGTQMAVNFAGGAVGLGLLNKDLGTAVVGFAVNVAFYAAMGPVGLIVAAAFMPKCDKYRAHVTRTCRDGNMEIDKVVIETQKVKRFFSCKWKGGGKEINPVNDAKLMAQVGSGGRYVLPPMPVESLADIEAEALAEVRSISSLYDLIVSSDEERFDRALAPAPEATFEEQQAFNRILNAFESKEVSVVNAYLNDVRSLVRSVPTVRSPASSGDASLLGDLNLAAARLTEQRNLGQAYVASLGKASQMTAGQRSRVNEINTEIKNIDSALVQINGSISNINSAVAAGG